MKIEVSNGEILDKLSILEIKSERITDKKKLINVENERKTLMPLYSTIVVSEELKKNFFDLLKINTDLWEIEDKIRIKESSQEFDYEFIELARSVYKKNDIRAQIKKEINILSDSKLIEEKSYV